jgi:dTDP-glucose 4,6-dehydratase
VNVLITGVAGFLGSHLADAFLREGATVTGIDNMSTSSGENIAHLQNDARFRFIKDDVCEGIRHVGPPPQLILHFASPASPVDYASDPVGTLNVNASGTERCCKLALAHCARLVYASTSEVYGDPLVHPQPETYWGNVNPAGPRSCYDEGKRFGEAMVCAYRQRYGIDARIVRIFNTYGPRMRADDGRVVPTFIKQAMNGEPLTVFGAGTQTRSLCYVDDLIEGIVRYSRIDGPAHDVVNLGSDDEIDVNEIARVIAGVCGVELQKVNRPLPADDPARRRPDLTRARAMLHWDPPTSLEKGLSQTIAWYRTHPVMEKERVSS